MAGENIMSMRIQLAKPTPGAEELVAEWKALAVPNEKLRKAISLGLQKLVFRAAKERFTGQGPFPVAQHRLGNVSGRLKRDLHAEPATATAAGYQGRVGSVVEYFGIHEAGFAGNVSVRAHTRAPHTIKKRNMSRLQQSVRAHTRNVKIAARAPLRTAINEHAGTILHAEILKAAKP